MASLARPMLLGKYANARPRFSMKLLTATVFGLFGQKHTHTLEFKPDLNIITGKNGSGKTTIMKLIWYIISGQIVRALTEVDFTRVIIATSIYEITVIRTGSNTCRVRWQEGNNITDYKDDVDDDGDGINAEDIPNRAMRTTGSSIFFPTFRRIEGGFSSNEQTRRNPFEHASPRALSDLETALNALSTKLSSGNHRFVSALSTSDIEKLLLKQYTDASEVANLIQQETSVKIIDEIKEFKQEKYQSTNPVNDESGAAEAALDNIRNMIEDMDRQRVLALAQYDAIRELVLRIFAHSGIKVGRLSIGDAAASISSDALSAGEKQMLSFLCYNAFYESAIIFIDEPELSLHIDWQRQLFPTLFSQRKENQFIIATHSPFIYSRYPDHELVMHMDRGDNQQTFL